MTVVFSTGVPNCREGRLNPVGAVGPDWLRTVAVKAEELGYFSLWFNEFLQTEPNVSAKFNNPPNYYDPLITIAHLAALTKRIRFVTSTIVLPHHHPVLLNRQLETLDALTGGRITLGIGLGGSAEEFRQLRGDIPKGNRGEMMDEYVGALRTLWRDERRVSFEGRYVAFKDLESYPKPVQDPLPIFMAGEADGVLRRLAQFGDGWIDTFFLPEAIKEKAERIQAHARELHGKSIPMEITRQFYVSMADTPEEAQANYEASLPTDKVVPAPPQSDRQIEMNLIGTPDHVVSRLSEYVQAGVTEICAIFFSPDLDGAVHQMEEFAQRVIPEVA